MNVPGTIFFMYFSLSRMTESRKGRIYILITGYLSVFESLSQAQGLGEFFIVPKSRGEDLSPR